MLLALRGAEELRLVPGTVELETALVIVWVLAAIAAGSRGRGAVRAWLALAITAAVGSAALANLRAQLLTRFGAAATFELHGSATGGVTARIVVPRGPPA